MTEEEIQKHKDDIGKMSREAMARMWRHTPSGHVYFRSDLPLAEHFDKRFNSLGGFSPAISKKIGW